MSFFVESYVVNMFHLSATCTCQDVSSLGRGANFVFMSFSLLSPMLSRCSVFRQTCTCQDVSSLGRGSLMLSRCSVFWQRDILSISRGN